MTLPDPWGTSVFYQALNGVPILVRENRNLSASITTKDGISQPRFVTTSERFGMRPSGGRFTLVSGSSPGINLNKPLFVQDLYVRAKPMFVGGGEQEFQTQEEKLKQRMAPLPPSYIDLLHRDLARAYQLLIKGDKQGADDLVTSVIGRGVSLGQGPLAVRQIVLQWLNAQQGNHAKVIGHIPAQHLPHQGIDAVLRNHQDKFMDAFGKKVEEAFDREFRKRSNIQAKFNRGHAKGDQVENEFILENEDAKDPDEKPNPYAETKDGVYGTKLGNLEVQLNEVYEDIQPMKREWDTFRTLVLNALKKVEGKVDDVLGKVDDVSGKVDNLPTQESMDANTAILVELKAVIEGVQKVVGAGSATSGKIIAEAQKIAKLLDDLVNAQKDLPSLEKYPKDDDDEEKEEPLQYGDDKHPGYAAGWGKNDEAIRKLKEELAESKKGYAVLAKRLQDLDDHDADKIADDLIDELEREKGEKATKAQLEADLKHRDELLRLVKEIAEKHKNDKKPIADDVEDLLSKISKQVKVEVKKNNAAMKEEIMKAITTELGKSAFKLKVMAEEVDKSLEVNADRVIEKVRGLAWLTKIQMDEMAIQKENIESVLHNQAEISDNVEIAVKNTQALEQGFERGINYIDGRLIEGIGAIGTNHDIIMKNQAKTIENQSKLAFMIEAAGQPAQPPSNYINDGQKDFAPPPVNYDYQVPQSQAAPGFDEAQNARAAKLHNDVIDIVENMLFAVNKPGLTPEQRQERYDRLYNEAHLWHLLEQFDRHASLADWRYTILNIMPPDDPNAFNHQASMNEIAFLLKTLFVNESIKRNAQ